MKNNRIRQAVIIAVALSGAILNAVYCIGFLRAFFDPQYNFAIRQILVSAIILEFGWMALLLWVVLKPFERRAILLFTIIPIFFGNILAGINQLMDTPGNLGAFVINTLVGLVYSGLYVLAYLLGKPAESSQS